VFTCLLPHRWVACLAILVTITSACAAASTPVVNQTGNADPPLFTATDTLAPLPTSTPLPSPEPTSPVIKLREGFPAGECNIPKILIPTAAPVPRGLNGIDSTTGLHMTGEVNVIDLASYRLTVTGLVDQPLELSYDDIRCLPKVKVSCDLVCPGVFIDQATWAGAPIESVLALAGIQKGAKTLRLESADGYYARVDIDTALQAQAFLAYELEGQTLPILHGFPIRAVIPGVDGNRWVKWLVKIAVE
jgi:DMSO/TMAO reductase YedYZ molybdopterin-dependent catalytic subunit